MYVVVVVLSRAGVHVPVMPLFDIVGRGASEAPEHIGATALKVGVMLGLTVIVNVVVTAHCPAAGVNIYVVKPIAAVLIVVGFQVPVIPLFEAVGRSGATAFWQSGPI